MRGTCSTKRPPGPKDTTKWSWFAQEIVALLKTIPGGYRVNEVFRDWLAVVEVTLLRLPEQAAYAAEQGTIMPVAPEEDQQLFRLLMDRYGQHWETILGIFSEAFELLLDATTTPTDDSGTSFRDVLGDVYELVDACEKRRGQFFTPNNVCLLTVHMQFANAPQLVLERLKQALMHPDNPLGHAMLLGSALLAGEQDAPEEIEQNFLDYVIPAAWPFYKPVTVYEPAVGAGRLLLAAASQFPQWMIDYGLVQFYGQDIDADCVRMAKINVMLYGLNGWRLRWKIAKLQMLQRIRADQGEQRAGQGEQGEQANQQPDQPDQVAQLEQMILPLDDAFTVREDEQGKAA
jgi:hypothetical protein